MTTPNQLSPRQIEVLKLVSEGFKDEYIAQMLFISKASVKTHVEDIKNKLGIEMEKIRKSSKINQDRDVNLYSKSRILLARYYWENYEVKRDRAV